MNEGQFGEHVIRYVIRKLADAGVDIIEAGFLWEKYCGSDSARYLRIADIKKLLPEHMGNSKISLMADYIDLDGLEPYDGTVEYIRLSFKRNRLGWAMETMKKLQEKGYRCFMNPVLTVFPWWILLGQCGSMICPPGIIWWKIIFPKILC